MRHNLEFKIVRILMFLMALILLHSCKNSTTEILSKPGLWVVEQVKIKQDSSTPILLSNTISFHTPGVVGLPFFSINDSDEGTWNYEQIGDQEYVIIDAPNSPFKGKYKVSFHKRSEGKEIILELESSNVYIKASTLSAMIR